MKRVFGSEDTGNDKRITDASTARLGGLHSTEDSQHIFIDGRGNKFWYVDTSGGPVTITLPDATEHGPNAIFTVCRITGGTNALTVVTDGGNINGGTSFLIADGFSSYRFASNGTDYYVVGYIQDIERTGGAAGDGTTDDTAALQSVLTAGRVIVLGHKKTYFLTAGLVPSVAGTGIIGDGTATILMSTAAGHFDNTTNGAAEYGTTGCGIYFANLDKPIVKGVIFRPNAVVESRRVRPVGLKICTNITIDDNEAYNFTYTNGVFAINNCTGGSVSRNYIHDIFSNHAAGGQVTAIGIDIDAATDSIDLRVADNRLEDITVGAAFIAGTGYDATGIQCAGRTATGLKLCRNNIRNTGQGVDTYAKRCVISDNVLKDLYVYGISLKHGASYNLVTANTIQDAGLGGINLAGSGTAGDDNVAENLVIANTVIGINTAGTYVGGENTTCVIYSSGAVGVPTNNVIALNTLDGDSAGKYGIYSNAGAGTGQIIHFNVIKNIISASYSVAAGTYNFINEAVQFQPAGDYVTSASLATALSPYITSASVSTALSSYVTSASLASADYVSSTSLSVTLATYLTSQSASAGYAALSHSHINYLLIDQSVGTSTAYTISATTITQAYRRLEMIFDNLSHDDVGSQIFRVEASGDNGTGWSTTIGVTAANAAANNVDARVTIDNCHQTSASRVLRSDSTVSNTGTNPHSRTQVFTITTGYINALRVSPAAGNFDGGTVTLVAYT